MAGEGPYHDMLPNRVGPQTHRRRYSVPTQSMGPNIELERVKIDRYRAQTERFTAESQAKARSDRTILEHRKYDNYEHSNVIRHNEIDLEGQKESSKIFVAVLPIIGSVIALLITLVKYPL